MDLGSDIGDNKAMGGGFVGAIPASFATQMAYATGGLRRQTGSAEDQEMFGRLVLSRMNKLEEGMKEMIHEMRESRINGSHNSPSRSKERPGRPGRPSRPVMKRTKDKGREERRDSVKDIRRFGEHLGLPDNVSAPMSIKAAEKEQDWEDDEEAVPVLKSGSI